VGYTTLSPTENTVTPPLKGSVLSVIISLFDNLVKKFNNFNTNLQAMSTDNAHYFSRLSMLHGLCPPTNAPGALDGARPSQIHLDIVKAVFL
jgi:hypothetical protein